MVTNSNIKNATNNIIASEVMQKNQECMTVPNKQENTEMSFADLFKKPEENTKERVQEPTSLDNSSIIKESAEENSKPSNTENNPNLEKNNDNNAPNQNGSGEIKSMMEFIKLSLKSSINTTGQDSTHNASSEKENTESGQETFTRNKDKSKREPREIDLTLLENDLDYKTLITDRIKNW
eukprot:CAMPEP_0170539224 /NCGR_PEP_ID=MMETSP0209-20121228/103793_1 /TAXON_ID=665100 ORGANISM="Litonotus pictus, Strain P1" /NCGR_SAMPLE_ID=MMETSP0209 /ASSEMBLY_ACC=CAM_ASM_000301 /LENGTH=179 /DNA_ID=CAMNT_0010841089 /DNA_START=1312 /DNA_END=1848 /DNA_ORIENTATION=+